VSLALGLGHTFRVSRLEEALEKSRVDCRSSGATTRVAIASQRLPNNWMGTVNTKDGIVLQVTEQGVA